MLKISNKLSLFLAILATGSLIPLSQVLAAASSPGTNVISNGTIFMITDNNQRRPYTSAGAFLSYGFNSWSTVATANTEDLALSEGSFIPPRDGKIVCSDRGSDKGTCYLITNGKRAAFVSSKVFIDLGFSFAKTLTGDVSFLEKDSDISGSTEQHRPGVLINNKGTVSLVSSSGLMGIPSMDTLNTWGYSLADVVTANSSDTVLSQTSIISSRQGAQLSPIDSSPKNISESSLIQGYIDTHADLSSVVISAPEDGANVIDLIKKIEAIPSTKFDPVYPYLSSPSIELLNKAPNLKAYLESPSAHLAGMNLTSSNVQIFKGDTALYTQTKIQQGTEFIYNYYWVCQKENGIWKWDFIGSIKYQMKKSQQQNPSDAFVIGTGTSDITVTDAGYTDQPMVNDPNTGLFVGVKNSGQTTIEKFHLIVRLNTVVIVDETVSYELLPGKSAILAVPINNYWMMTGVNKIPGQYTTEINANLDNSTTDSNPIDNKFNLDTTFEKNDSEIRI